jgi:indole-3-acetate monooxygenase
VARAEALLGAAQTFRTAATTAIWQTVASGQETTLEQRAGCRLAASFAVDSARQAMDLMYRAMGTTSSKRTHQLARCWRDLYPWSARPPASPRTGTRWSAAPSSASILDPGCCELL